jgi:signal transduction histidine kinase
MRNLIGLRPRLLLALLVTSAVTIGAAAAALLPPLQDRLRRESARSLEAAALAARPTFEDALRRSGGVADLRIIGLANSLAARTNSRVSVLDFIPMPVYETDPDAALPSLAIHTTLNASPPRTVRLDVGNVVDLAVPLRGPDHTYVLALSKPLSDVGSTVRQVRDAFLKAALVGLLAAVLLGLALTTTLLRRLDRLRRAALRVTEEGPGAPPPRDDSADEVGDLARAFAAMQDALRRQEDARRAFVATASHELRTPLTSLQGTLELLDEDLSEGRLDLDDAHEQVTAARGELLRLGNLATELLDLSRLDAGVPLRHEPVELGELSRAVGSEFELRARDAGSDLEVVPPIGPCWASGDPSAIARVVRILLDNALRYTPPGSRIRVTSAYHGEHALVEVADSGPGVPEQERELIFQRFQRGSRTAGEGGFGLGLAIARELVQRLGGTLRLSDDGPLSGACFVCALPIELPSGSHAPVDEGSPVA